MLTLLILLHQSFLGCRAVYDRFVIPSPHACIGWIWLMIKQCHKYISIIKKCPEIKQAIFPLVYRLTSPQVFSASCFSEVLELELTLG